MSINNTLESILEPRAFIDPLHTPKTLNPTWTLRNLPLQDLHKEARTRNQEGSVNPQNLTPYSNTLQVGSRGTNFRASIPRIPLALTVRPDAKPDHPHTPISLNEGIFHKLYQYPLIKEYSLNYNSIPIIIYGIFLNYLKDEMNPKRV